jgi:hypothetical protein
MSWRPGAGCALAGITEDKRVEFGERVKKPAEEAREPWF